MGLDLFRMSDDEVISMVRRLGGRVQYFPMVAVQSIESIARGSHPSACMDVEWMELRTGAERLLSQAEVLRNIDPLKTCGEKHICT